MHVQRQFSNELFDTCSLKAPYLGLIRFVWWFGGALFAAILFVVDRKHLFKANQIDNENYFIRKIQWDKTETFIHWNEYLILRAKREHICSYNIGNNYSILCDISEQKKNTVMTRTKYSYGMGIHDNRQIKIASNCGIQLKQNPATPSALRDSKRIYTLMFIFLSFSNN